MIDYIKQEEKLIKAELTVRECIKQKETLEKIDAILRRYDTRTPEKLSCQMKTAEHLSKKMLSIPLKVRGKMLGVGRHKERYYTTTELMKAVKKYEDKKFPIKLDHRDKEVASIVGVVDRIFWIPSENAIGYDGHINDKTMALNILDGVVNDVSATIFSMKDFDEQLGVIGFDLDFTELSLVTDGAYKDNTIKAVI